MIDPDAPDAYHRWYYDTGVWQKLRYLGIPVLKSVGDLWTYQEILHELEPALVVESGTWAGGSALYLAHVLERVRPDGLVVTIDVDPSRIDPKVRACPLVRVVTASSTDPEVGAAVRDRRRCHPGPMFVILDSDHSRDHVLAELELFADLMSPGDYLVVEDGNINGHPVLPGFGPGPTEALEIFRTRHPGRFDRDRERESKFGFTFAPGGFLVRR